ncbi:MAG: hypothetical protein AB8G26_14620 [Ilumatobacter sp.]
MIATTRRHHALVGGAAALLALTASGCGAIVERATEEAVERAVEAENGGDVEVDFDADSGTFSVESDEGDITFNLDEDGLQIEGTDAEGDDFSLEADENGITAEGEGGETIEIDDDGTFTSTNEDGEVTTGEFDPDTGEFTIEGEDGEAIFKTFDAVPDEWPDDVPEPSGLSGVTGQFIAEEGSIFILLSGQAGGSVDEVFDDYTGRIEDAGFTRDSTFTDATNSTSTFTRNGTESVSVSASDISGSTTLSITYTR